MVRLMVALAALFALAACSGDPAGTTGGSGTSSTEGAGGTSGSTTTHGSTGSTSSSGNAETTGSNGGTTGKSSSSTSGTTGGSGSTGAGTSASTSTGGTNSTTSGTTTSGSGSTSSGSGSTGSGYIDHLVIIVLENHTFDSVFSGFPGAESRSHFVYDGGVEFDAPHAPDALPRDLCHEHDCALLDWNHGAMDGWLQNPNASQNGDHLAWSQYRESDVPGFWALARNYGLADHFFASMLGPSFPGHTFLLAAQAGGALGNPHDPNTDPLPLLLWGCDDSASSIAPIENERTCQVDQVHPCFDMPSAPETLRSGATWKFYGTGINSWWTNTVWTMFDAVYPIWHDPAQWSHIVPYRSSLLSGYEGNFENDVKNGALPNVTWLVDQDLDSGHPPLSMCDSVSWATHYANDIIKSQYWSHAAVIITWDDFGGWVDHVPPPQQYGCDLTHPYGMGFRIPAIIISPYVKKGVFHGVTEQASVVRLVEELFGAPGAVGSLHAQDSRARDDVAGSLLSAFDFNQQPLPAIPASEVCPAQ